MIDTWFGTTAAEAGLVVLSGVLILLWAIAMIRTVGLRSLAKMSNFDFITTIAFGSIIAGVASTDASAIHGALAIATLLGMQWVIARLRCRTPLERLFDNTPILLMDGPRLLRDNLSTARVTESDLFAKLREANVTDLDQVLAVVLETTGDISVLHGDGPLDPDLLDGVRRGQEAPAGDRRR